MCICDIHTHTHTLTHTHTHTLTHTLTHTHTHTHSHTLTHIHTLSNTHTHSHTPTQAEHLVENIRSVFIGMFGKVSWMDAKSQQTAIEKVTACSTQGSCAMYIYNYYY